MTISNLAINPNGLAFDLVNGNSFKLNDVGIGIINYLNEGLHEEEIAKKLSEELSVDYDSVLIDIVEFITKMKIFGIME